MITVIRQLSDSVEQDHFVRKIAKILSVAPEALTSKLNETPAQRTTRKQSTRQPVEIDRYALDLKKIQDKIMALGLMRPGLREDLATIKSEFLPEEQARTLFDYLLKHPAFDGTLQGVSELKKVTEYVKIVSLQYEDLYQDQDDVELKQELKRQMNSLIKQYVKTKNAEISYQLEQAGGEYSPEILQQVNQLNALLKTHQTE